MHQIATTRSRIEIAHLRLMLPLVLAVNTLALVGLDQVGGIPSWIKTAATLFLSF